LDPLTQQEVYSADDIKAVSLQYGAKLFENREPRVGYEGDIISKQLVHQIRITEVLDNYIDETFENSINVLKLKNPAKYPLVIKGGTALKKAIFNLCSKEWRTELIPEKWEETTLVQLYKGKGPRSNLNNMRHIHIKDDLLNFY